MREDDIFIECDDLSNSGESVDSLQREPGEDPSISETLIAGRADAVHQEGAGSGSQQQMVRDLITARQFREFERSITFEELYRKAGKKLGIARKKTLEK